MRLTDDEKAMLDGKQGAAKQKAMDFLVRYGEALDAERLVDTNNVCVTVGAATPMLRDLVTKAGGGLHAAFSEFNLDSSTPVTIPRLDVFTCQLVQALDADHWQLQNVAPETLALHRENEAFNAELGIQQLNTCTPYQVGNIPVKGEHCAWMESSAVIYINSVLGACTNAEGRESAGAAAVSGKTPYWGFHTPESRRGTDLIEVEIDVGNPMDWDLLGYYAGEFVQEGVPVITGIHKNPTLTMLKQFGASASSSGGIEMYHLPGITSDANTVAEAFGGNTPRNQFRYGKAERRAMYDALNSANTSTAVDFVMLGCPHYSTQQLAAVCQLLKGRHVSRNTALWIFTPRGLHEIADQSGFTKIITDAGGVLMSDTCPSLGQVLPKNTKVAAVDSGKQAHYLPAITGVQTWFGSTADCIEAAITGIWKGELA